MPEVYVKTISCVIVNYESERDFLKVSTMGHPLVDYPA